MLEVSREQLLHGGVAHRGGARPVPPRVRLDLQKWVLDLLAAVLVAGLPVFVVPLLVVLLPMLVGLLFFLRFGASARVDVGEVERVGLGEVAQVELYEDSIRSVLEGGGAAHPGVALRVQSERGVTALGMSSVVVLLPTLGTATGAPYQQENSRERQDTEEEYRYLPHSLDDTIGGSQTASSLWHNLPRG